MLNIQFHIYNRLLYHINKLFLCYYEMFDTRLLSIMNRELFMQNNVILQLNYEPLIITIDDYTLQHSV